MKKHYVRISIFLIIAFTEASHVCASDTLRAVVQVDCSIETGLLRRSELYNNNSLLRTPVKAITDKYLKEIGITKIMRCWVTINDYWNYSSDEYDYNFKCGFPEMNNLWDNFYDYMERFSEISEELLLNVRGYQIEVTEGKITMEQWRTACKNGIKHYKEKFPKIKYIEVLNEYPGFARINDEKYYQYYKEFYAIVNEVNTELKPNIPLLIGGPCVHLWHNTQEGNKPLDMRLFLKNYAADKDPAKKLDFISYHNYSYNHNDLVNDPSLVKGEQQAIENLCKEFGLPLNIPIFNTEGGFFPVDIRYNCLRMDQLIQAAGMNSLFYFYNKQPNIQAFHWVIQHLENERKNQIYDNLQWSPYGISLKMLAKMGEIQISAKTPALNNGKGIYTLASKDKDKERIVIQIWNYQGPTGNKYFNVQLNTENLPELFKGKKLQINEYLLDSDDNNYDYNGLITKPGEDQLKITKKSTIDKQNNINLNAVLEPNAIILFELMPE